MHPALHFHLTPIPPIRKRAARELVVAGHAADHCLPTHGGHPLLPERFARDSFPLSHLMNLQVARGRPAGCARLGIQAAYECCAGQRDRRAVWWDGARSWFGLAAVLEREDLQMSLLPRSGRGVDQVVPPATPASDLGDGCPGRGRQRCEEARSPQRVARCQPVFGPVCPALIVRQSPQRRMVGQDDFCVAALPPSWSVARTAALIVALAVRVATATPRLVWDAPPHPLGDGPTEGVGRPASLPDPLIRRARQPVVSQDARALCGIADGRRGFGQVQVQGGAPKVPDPGHDPAGLGRVADDADADVIGIAAVVQPSVRRVLAVHTRQHVAAAGACVELPFPLLEAGRLAAAVLLHPAACPPEVVDGVTQPVVRRVAPSPFARVNRVLHRLPVPIELVEVALGEERRDDPPVWPTPGGVVEGPVRHGACLPPGVDEGAEPTVLDALLQQRAQEVVLHGVGEALEVHLESPLAPVPALDCWERGVAGAVGAQSRRSRREARFLDQLQQASDHCLAELVVPRRQAERASLPRGLGDGDAAHGLTAIAALFEAFDALGYSCQGEAVPGDVLPACGGGTRVRVDLGLCLTPALWTLQEPTAALAPLALFGELRSCGPSPLHGGGSQQHPLVFGVLPGRCQLPPFPQAVRRSAV
jgi:hypothetical protein